MLADHYRAQRDELIELVTSCGATGREPVPACPGWSVSDVLGHLTGLADSWLTRELEVYASTAWTRKQVDAWSSSPLEETCAAWVQRGDRLAEMLDNLGQASGLPTTITTIVGPYPTASFGHGILIDLTQHCHDVATALDAAMPDRLGTVPMTTRALVKGVHQIWKVRGHQTIRIASDEAGEIGVLGEGRPNTTLTAPVVDIFRSMGGRRTIDQIQELHWNPAAPEESVLADLVVGFFALPASRVESATQAQRDADKRV